LVGIDSPFVWELAKSMHNVGFDVLVSSFNKDVNYFSADFLNLLKVCDVEKQNVTDLSLQKLPGQAEPLKVSYQVFANEIKELNFIIDFLLSKMQEKDCTVAIVIDDLETIHTLVCTLKGYGICVKNLVGLSLTRNITIDFLLLIGKLQSPNALVKDLIALLKHSYFDSDIGKQFEHFALEKGLILRSLQDSLSVLCSQCCQIYEIYASAFFFDKAGSFQSLLTQHFKAAQRLFPGIWSCSEYGHVQEYLSNLLIAARHFKAMTIDSYCDILTKLLQGKFYEHHFVPSNLNVLLL
jgi:hypothetical protein